MRKIYAHGLCAEPYNKDNYSGKATCFLLDFFLGYLQRRQSKMAEWGDTSYASYAKNVTIYICVETASQYELKQKEQLFCVILV